MQWRVRKRGHGLHSGPRALLTNDHVVAVLEKRLGGAVRPGKVVARFGLERAPEERFPAVAVRGVGYRATLDEPGSGETA